MEKHKRLFIIHGWEANPNVHWFPWLKQEAEERGFVVEVPAMPDTEHPTLEGWRGHLASRVGVPDEHIYFVGHSLGCVAILRYIESLPEGARVGGVILVAGFSEPIAYEELNNFFPTPVQYEKIKKIVRGIVIIQSRGDHVVPMKYGEILHAKLGGKFAVIDNAGHFNTDDGFLQFPLVLEELLGIARGDNNI